MSPTFCRLPLNDFSNLLAGFSELTLPSNLNRPVKHLVTHHILTTGPPVDCRPRRLLEMLRVTRMEFEHLLQL